MRLNLSWRGPSADNADQAGSTDPMQAIRPGRASRWLVALRAACCGLLVGVLVVLYRQGIGYGTRFARWAYAQMHVHPLMVLPWLLAALLVGLALAWMVGRVPMASGSGIPQVEGVVIHGMRDGRGPRCRSALPVPSWFPAVCAVTVWRRPAW